MIQVKANGTSCRKQLSPRRHSIKKSLVHNIFLVMGISLVTPFCLAEGAFHTGEYPNLFVRAGVASESEVQTRIKQVYQQLFHHSDEAHYDPNDASVGKRLFIEVGDDMAYIWDTGNNDVRSEGMSYGMMIALQMNRQEDFNKLWKWARTYSLNTSGSNQGYYAWQVSTGGNHLDSNPAPDGEEYFVTALMFAANRWGNGEGIFNYSAQANQLLTDMYGNNKWHYVEGQKVQYSLFQHDEFQIVFSPVQDHPNNHTDPSYHLPAFYELWARWADDTTDKNRNPDTGEHIGTSTGFWERLAPTSRNFLQQTVNATTGLNPDYAHFDGTPEPGHSYPTNHDNFRFDAWRTVGNAALDHLWWGKDSWQITYADTLQNFFANVDGGISGHGSLFTLSGAPDDSDPNISPLDHSPGLVAMNAMASLAASNTTRANAFVQELWNTPIPTGRYRYYDGMLYMLGMLAVSGNYRIYCPDDDCQSGAPAPQPDPDPEPDPDPQPEPEPDPEPVTEGTLVSMREVEDGVFSPSYRETNNQWAALYSNGEQVAFSENLSSGSYTLVIHGRSSNGSAAGISVYADNTKVGETYFTATGGEDQLIPFQINQSASQIRLVLETDFGQNDTLLDKYYLYSGAPSDPTDSTDPTDPADPAPTDPPPAGSLVMAAEFEDGTFTPSYRDTDQEWAVLYGNGEQIAFPAQIPAGDYLITIEGRSSNGTNAGISVYAGNTRIVQTSFTSTSGEEVETAFSLDNASEQLRFVLETDVGQNDTYLNWFSIHTSQ